MYNINNIEVTETHDPNRPYKAWYKVYFDTPVGPRIGEGIIVYDQTAELVYDRLINILENSVQFKDADGVTFKLPVVDGIVQEVEV